MDKLKRQDSKRLFGNYTRIFHVILADIQEEIDLQNRFIDEEKRRIERERPGTRLFHSELYKLQP